MRISIVSFLMMVLCSCSVNYSLTSTSAPNQAKSISIANFYNESPSGPPNLSQYFTEEAKSYYQNNTKLELVPFNGDLSLEGAITGYNVIPVAPQQGVNGLDVAALNRLTITVRAKYTNKFNEKDNFDQSFSFFSDFENTKSLSDVEDALIDEISEQIILQIFTRSFDNW